ncbi:MAG: energy transducer TonB [Saprospiraceae bacterium]
MMKFKLTILLLFCIGYAYAQPDTEVYTQVEQMPYFKGCEAYDNGDEQKRNCSNQALIAYLANHLIYPAGAKAKGLEGTVYVSFVIDENGRLTQPYLIRDIGGDCGQAALDVIQSMPRWEPGIHHGQAVKVKLNLPIQFSLKSQEPDVSDNYTLFWGGLKGEKVSRTFLKQLADTPLSVRDQFGNQMNILELSFAYQWKRKFRSAKSRGDIDKSLKKILKKLRIGSLFSITVTVQEGGDFIEVNRIFEVTE